MANDTQLFNNSGQQVTGAALVSAPPTQAYSNIPTDVGTAATFPFWGSPVLQDQNGNLFCPGYTGNTYASSAYDFCVINGNLKTPGVCELVIGKGRDHDVKKSKGVDGANITFSGIMPAEVQIRITIWTPTQLAAFNAFYLQVFPGVTKGGSTSSKSQVAVGYSVTQTASGTTINQRQYASTNTQPRKTTPANAPKHWPVSHPDLITHKIKALYFVRGEGFSPGPVRGARVFTLHCREYLPPSKGSDATFTGVGAAALASTLENPTPGSNPRNLNP